MDQARQIALARPNVDEHWYDSVFLAALSSMASRQGQTLEVYVQAITQPDFVAMVDELRQGVRSDQPPTTRVLLFGPHLRPSIVYPGFWRYKETGLLVSGQDLQQSGGTPSPQLQRFIQAYEGSGVEWYRGVGISHFAWATLRSYGTLTSEGTADIPTFTMGNATPTRWIPGDLDEGTAQALAATVSRDAPGLRELLEQGVPFPSGAVLGMKIKSPAPVAWLNQGEQVVRGPIPEASLEVRAVHVYGAGGMSRWTERIPGPRDLPPAAPYGEPAGSPAIGRWAGEATAWVDAH
jgi:hypothetical protein